MTERAPYHLGRRSRLGPLVADNDLRTSADGQTLIGGSPLRIMRLTEAGAKTVKAWFDGGPVADSDGAQKLARRLLDTGIAHPQPASATEVGDPGDPNDNLNAAVETTLVIPAYNNADAVEQAVASLRRAVEPSPEPGHGDSPADADGVAPLAPNFAETEADTRGTDTQTALSNAYGSGDQHDTAAVLRETDGAHNQQRYGPDQAEQTDRLPSTFSGSTTLPERAANTGNDNDNDTASPIIIVDDASSPGQAAALAQLATTYGAQLIRRQTNGGPGAARNTGWRAARTELVALIDADVTVSAGWLPPLLAHLADPLVGAVAPRVISRSPGVASDLLARYEARRSPLDMGDRPGRVAPRSRISYVPTAALMVRREALETVGGFDETMRVGEDVDLVWRLGRAGHRIRFEPTSIVAHACRATWTAVAHQRRSYGTAAADLETRHPGMVAPVELNAWSLLSWTLMASGGPYAIGLGLATATAATAGLVPKLRGKVDQPVAEAVRLGGLGHLHAGRWLAAAVTRSWLPAFAVGSLFSKRLRRATAAAAMVPPALEWLNGRPPIHPAQWIALRLFDDASYCLGVWQGCHQQQSASALKPRLTNIDGLDT